MEHDTSESKHTDSISVEMEQKENGYFAGSCDCYEFKAKIDDKKSEDGINDGRVVKVYVYESKEIDGQTWMREAAVYNRGWRTKPEGKEDRMIFSAILFCLEQVAAGKIR